MEDLPYGGLAALIGLAAGIVLGLAARLGDFCTLGALESAAYGRDQKRLRLWGVVLGTAILATQGAAALGWADLDASAYHSIAWNPLASILGGVIFGYGMALAGNCGFSALVRFGGGDLRAMIVVIVMGIAGFMTLSGPLGPVRQKLFPQIAAPAPQGIVADLATRGVPGWVVVMVLGLVPLAVALFHKPLRQVPRMVFWGVAAGLAVAGSFIGTTWLAQDSLGAVAIEGPSFTAPVGRTLIYLMTSTGGGLTFSVGSVLGVLIGAVAGSALRGLFRWEACEDPRELGRLVGGAVLMGVGGVIAMGCSVGQGITAFATLAWSGPVTLAAITLGALIGLRQLMTGFRLG
ncbi:hypothetical protein C8J27_101539 [Rhodobacter aestuarii]|uniref:Uncharacterized protein n=1 Tax=Rhodobacter aestuarii TaxID=453582 RepID=A0A1N7IXK1_9RHOB|nr:YeeE/YedE family protein [Rhodobacter aestuarii]PTV97424.1 hypothetical protein C8J27_101539 [Rhodobacter aestuarii]SIS41823.1 hypothetical protein SAMN05421580_101103 [Rhodobacter aestuarii]